MAISKSQKKLDNEACAALEKELDKFVSLSEWCELQNPPVPLTTAMQWVKSGKLVNARRWGYRIVRRNQKKPAKAKLGRPPKK